jgi:hypothetical protein
MCPDSVRKASKVTEINEPIELSTGQNLQGKGQTSVAKTIFCPFCKRDMPFRTRLFILHESQLHDMTFEKDGTLGFSARMDHHHQLGICRECREKVTVAQLYKMVME